MIQAQAEANANIVITQSLTPKLIQKIKLDKWKDNVLQIQGNATIIISIE